MVHKYLYHKSTISVILLLKPQALPGMTDERVCLESPVLKPIA